MSTAAVDIIDHYWLKGTNNWKREVASKNIDQAQGITENLFLVNSHYKGRRLNQVQQDKYKSTNTGV